jgi:hypothetical protein
MPTLTPTCSNVIQILKSYTVASGARVEQLTWLLIRGVKIAC